MRGLYFTTVLVLGCTSVQGQLKQTVQGSCNATGSGKNVTVTVTCTPGMTQLQAQQLADVLSGLGELAGTTNGIARGLKTSTDKQEANFRVVIEMLNSIRSSLSKSALSPNGNTLRDRAIAAKSSVDVLYEAWRTAYYGANDQNIEFFDDKHTATPQEKSERLEMLRSAANLRYADTYRQSYQSDLISLRKELCVATKRVIEASVSYDMTDTPFNPSAVGGYADFVQIRRDFDELVNAYISTLPPDPMSP